MKVKIVIERIESAINTGDFNLANSLLNKYRLKFGNRHFSYWLRLVIKNGLWVNEK